MMRPFHEVDVFTDTRYQGNPVAVVLDADGLSTEEMQQVANWTNLSETTFVLPPSAPEAHYRVRIFTPVSELPFAGHPTLGTCHTWLSVTPEAEKLDVVVQECEAGLIALRRIDGRLAFGAPPQTRSGPVEEDLTAELARQVGVARSSVVDAQWVDNGPGWVALLLDSADAVLAARPGAIDHEVGIVGLYPPGSPEAVEVRAFFQTAPGTAEDPVTGSLNASLAQWLLATGRLQAPYVAAQGTVLGRRGRVHISQDDDGTVWVAGGTITCVSGQIDL